MINKSLLRKIYIVGKFSLGYLQSKSHKSRPSVIVSLCITGVAISVATLILVTSVMNGFRDELIKKIVGISSHITIQSFSNSNYVIDDILVNDLNRNYSDTAVINAIFQGNGMLISQKRNAGVIVKGINFLDIYKRKVLMDGIGDISGCNENSIIVGQGIANNLHKKIGDSVTLLVPQFSNTIFGSIPRSISLDICGIFSFGDQYDSYMIMADLNKMLLIYGLDNPQEIEIVANNFNDAEVLTKQIRQQYGRKFFIQTWKESNYSLTQALNIQRNVIFVILTLFLIMTIFTISGNLLSLVNEKSKNIAILKTIGMSSKEIGAIFFLASIIISTIGTIIGILIGLLISFNVDSIRLWLENALNVNLFDQNIYMLSYLPAKIEYNNVIMIVIMTLTLSTAASILPAVRASKKKPLELLS